MFLIVEVMVGDCYIFFFY